MPSLLTVLLLSGAPAAPPGNAPPEAAFRTTPRADADNRVRAQHRHKVTFNMCASHDADPGDTLAFWYDYGDGSTPVRGRCRRSHVYGKGVWKARICVGDRQEDHRICQGYVVEMP